MSFPFVYSDFIFSVTSQFTSDIMCTQKSHIFILTKNFVSLLALHCKVLF